jgi:peroxidase
MSKFGKKMEITSLGTGAHTIGVAHCSAFANRLSPTVDSTLNPIFAALLETECPSGSTETVNLAVTTPTKFDKFYYLNLRANKGLLTSDQELQSDPSTSGFVNANSFFPTFAANFRNAIIAMGNINVLTGTAGNIRLNCRKFNS